MSSAFELFKEQGYLKCNTADIALRAGTAHGTLFLHFGTKEQLLFECIEERLIDISNRLSHAARDAENLESMLRIYLHHIGNELEFETMIAREMPLLPVSLQRKIMAIRSGIAADFYQVLEWEMENGTIRHVDPAMALNFWFGTLNYYLANQALFAGDGNIIETSGNQLISYFIQSLRR